MNAHKNLPRPRNSSFRLQKQNQLFGIVRILLSWTLIFTFLVCAQALVTSTRTKTAFAMDPQTNVISETIGSVEKFRIDQIESVKKLDQQIVTIRQMYKDDPVRMFAIAEEIDNRLRSRGEDTFGSLLWRNRSIPRLSQVQIQIAKEDPNYQDYLRLIKTCSGEPLDSKWEKAYKWIKSWSAGLQLSEKDNEFQGLLSPPVNGEFPSVLNPIVLATMRERLISGAGDSANSKQEFRKSLMKHVGTSPELTFALGAVILKMDSGDEDAKRVKDTIFQRSSGSVYHADEWNKQSEWADWVKQIWGSESIRRAWEDSALIYQLSHVGDWKRDWIGEFNSRGTTQLRKITQELADAGKDTKTTISTELKKVEKQDWDVSTLTPEVTNRVDASSKSNSDAHYKLREVLKKFRTTAQNPFAAKELVALSVDPSFLCEK